MTTPADTAIEKAQKGKPRLRDREEAAAAELERLGVMISRPGDGIEESGLKWRWGVCVGSHGGWAKTLRGAMSKCLKCCGIGKFWRTNHGEGELLCVEFERIKDAMRSAELSSLKGKVG